MKLFGFELVSQDDNNKHANIPAIVAKDTDDGALIVSAGGSFGTYLDLEGSAKTEAEIVAKYREMSIQPEAELAIDAIVNEAIVKENNENIIDINLDDVQVSDPIKDAIKQAWDMVAYLLEINTHGYDIFKRWYIDGRLYYHVMIDEDNPRAGVQEFRYIDPRKIRKVRAVNREKKNGIYVNVTENEYYMFNERGFKGSSSTNMDNQGLIIAKDSIIFTPSGIVDKDNRMVLGYLHPAIKPLNQLRVLEDSTVIYALNRAPSRRVFKVEVGNLPPAKAEMVLRDQMTRHRNRLVYDAVSGNVKDDRKFMHMLEDFFIPVRNGKGGEIEQLPPGQNLGDVTNIRYFERKLYQSLKVPVSRLEPETGYNLGRASEITRDELMFQKFIFKLRLKFADFLLNALEKQLVLTGIITKDDWEVLRTQIHFDFRKDNYFAELKDAEILQNRLNVLATIDPYVGKYYSVRWVRKNVLHMTDDDIAQMDEEMKSDPVWNTPGLTQDQAYQGNGEPMPATDQTQQQYTNETPPPNNSQ